MCIRDRFTVPLLILLVVLMVAIVAFIVFVERSERRIPVQYAKRIVGRRLMGGQSTHLPLKVNSGGVMPIIFASSILSAPMLFGQVEWVQNSKLLQPIMQALAPGYPWYELLDMLGIIFFAYFYAVSYTHLDVYKRQEEGRQDRSEVRETAFSF